MKISLNELRFYQQRYQWSDEPAPDGAQALVEKIGAQLGAVEEAVDFGARFKDAIIVKLVECRKHENADHLNVCKIDDGGRAQDVERDEYGHVQVVCGAPNVRAGIAVVWLPPGATVPESIVKGESFVLEARAIRGEISNGMLASARELSIGDNHDGILEIVLDSDEEMPTPGTRLADVYHLDGDVIIDIENKMFTHRPDCFGMIGVAREIAGIQQQQFKSPDWFVPDAQLPQTVEAEPLPLEIRNELPELVPRFAAVTMRDVEVRDSPLWLQLDLVRVGMRPINNIVDYTNYFMHLAGQPLHAYDYDKVRALCDADHAVLAVRHPLAGEKVRLLNGKVIEPRAEAIMIATDRELIGIGGVMGGGDTEVDERTRNIILECATFDMYSIRKTSMTHGLFTDAVTRFSKGQSPLQNRAVLCKIADEIARFAGGKIASDLIDDNHVPAEALERGSIFKPVQLPPEFINERLGIDTITLDRDLIVQLLENVEFKVERGPLVQIKNGEVEWLTITAPIWRTDIETPEDIVEEVGRLYGFDHLPLELPKRSLAPAAKDDMLELKARLRARLVTSGANEVLTYSFVHGNLLDKVGQDKSQAFQLGNALSPDLQYFRLSLMPSLLDKIHGNIKAGHDEFAIFEIGKAHIKNYDDGDGLPQEFERIALVFAADKKATQAYAGAPFYQARAYVMSLFAAIGLAEDVRFEPQDGDDQDSAATYYAPGRAAIIKAGGHIIGRIGEFAPSVRRGLKLPDFCAGFELGLAPLLEQAREGAAYAPLSKFPKVEQDICLKVTARLDYQELFDFADGELNKNAPPHVGLSLTPIDIFQREDDSAHRQITLRVSVVSFEKTLRDEEVSRLLDRLARVAAEKFQAERI